MSGSIISFFIDYIMCDGSLSCWIWLIRWSVAHKKMIKTTQNVLTYNDSDTITSTMSVGLEHATSLLSLYEAVFLKPFTFNETVLMFMYVGSLGSCISHDDENLWKGISLIKLIVVISCVHFVNGAKTALHHQKLINLLLLIVSSKTI